MKRPIDTNTLEDIRVKRGWTDAKLDAWRERSDELGDEGIARLLRRHDQKPSLAAIDLLRREAEAGFPTVGDYRDAVAPPPDLDGAKLVHAHEIFDVFGAQILMVLGLYALPAAFAAPRGVQVVYATGELSTDPLRRVWETKRFVADVLAPKALLTPEARGVKAIRTVRLFHALTRARLEHPDGDLHAAWQRVKSREEYRQGLGRPLNQEDKAGNLMEFAVVVIEGLERVGIELTPEQEEGYVHAWNVIGTMLGVAPELLPANVEEGVALATIIRRRQVGQPHPSEEGRKLTQALLTVYRGKTPWFASGLPRAFLRLFLGRDPFRDPRQPPEDVARMLGFPPGWTPLGLLSSALVAGVRFFSDVMDRWFDAFGPSDLIVRWLSRRLLLEVQRREDNPGRFEIEPRTSAPPPRHDPRPPLVALVPPLNPHRIARAQAWRAEIKRRRRA